MAEKVFLGGMIICFCWSGFDIANWIKERFFVKNVIQGEKCLALALIKFMMFLGCLFLFFVARGNIF